MQEIYETIYTTSYEFGFVFIDEDEIDEDDSQEFYYDDDTLILH